jgi:mannose-6-phosphate isomerase-like protein (cupin superfamily)
VVTTGEGAATNGRVGHRQRVRAARRTWIVEPGEGRRVKVGADDCTVKVQDARAGSPYSLLEVVLDPGAAAMLVHAHYDFTETYFVSEGEVLAEVGDERERVGAGSTLCLPVGASHALSAVGPKRARCLCITDRANQSDLEFLP